MRKITFLVLSFVYVHCYAQPAGYLYGKYVSIDGAQVSGAVDFTDFTMLFSTTDLELRSVANGGSVESEDGFDIVFTLGDCATLLNHQIEKYDPVSGELVYWVKIPNLSGTGNTNIHMYYGNPAVALDPSSFLTWNANHEGVWHMNNDPSSSLLLDYSGDGIDGESHGTMTSADLVDGIIGDAIDFDGANDYFSLAAKSFTAISEITQMTVSAWVKTSFDNPSNFTNWSILDYDRSEYFNFFISGNGRLCYASSRGGISDSYAGSAGDLNDDNWHHVAAVYNGTDKLLYIDGALALTVANPHGGVGMGDGTTRFGFIGEGSEATVYNGSRNNIYYDGIYDEIRYTTDILTSDWIQTEFNNQSSPGTFYTIGAEMDADDLCFLLPIELNIFEANQLDDGIQLSWSTLSERNNSHFIIEHAFDKELDWKPIGQLDGAGTSSTQLDYSIFHEKPSIGINYYRLTQVDFNGTSEQFDPISIEYSNHELITLFPNPSNGLLTITSAQKLNPTHIHFHDITGKEITNLIEIIPLSNKHLRLNINGLEKGIYSVSTEFGTYRFIKN